MQTAMMKTSIRASVARPAARSSVKVMAFNKQAFQAAAVGMASLALTGSAFAGANVKLGADSGALVFEPSSVTISKGDTVTWTNNAGFPHNIVFDEDAVPAGVNADSLSNEDYLNAPGETVTRKFDVAGEYGYYCEPHQGAGMQGKVIVN